MLARPEEDLIGALAALADELGARGTPPPLVNGPRPAPATGAITSEALGASLGALLPENAIVVDEAVTTGRGFFASTSSASPHDWLSNMGGSIGMGMPVATGAAVACPDRKVVCLEGDGSGMYTLQALWTQAREGLDVTTLLFSNKSYAILRGELANVGAGNPGRKALDMLDLGHPDLDWVGLAALWACPAHGSRQWRRSTTASPRARQARPVPGRGRAVGAGASRGRGKEGRSRRGACKGGSVRRQAIRRRGAEADPADRGDRRGRHGEPFAFLGMHEDGGGSCVRVILPDAAAMAVVDSASGAVVADGRAGSSRPVSLSPRSPGGIGRFAIGCGSRWGGDWHEFDDLYRFPPVLGELDLYLLGEGSHLASYRKLGAHPTTLTASTGVAFAVWAPNARRVSVVGDFNGWDGRRHPMRVRHAGGFWELFVPGARAGERYKYEIVGPRRRAAAAEGRPACRRGRAAAGTASIVARRDPRMRGRTARGWRGAAGATTAQAPISIYEVHLGSWRRNRAEGERI